MATDGCFMDRLVVSADFLEESGFLDVAAFLRGVAKDFRRLKRRIPVRVMKCLRKLGIPRLEDLKKFTAYQILELKNVGQATLGQIRILLAEKGLRLSDEQEA